MDPADLKARTEARRRKILENASSRLEKITGKKCHENPNNLPDSLTNGFANEQPLRQDDLHPVERNHYCPNFTGAKFEMDINDCTEKRFPNFELPGTAATSGEDNDVSNFHHNPESSLSGPAQIQPNLTQSKTYLDTILFLTLGLLMRIGILFIPNLSKEVFLLFLLFGLPRMFLSQWYSVSLGNIAPWISIFTGFHQQVLLAIIKAVALLRTLFKFSALYLFGFVITHCLIEGARYKVRQMEET